MNRELLALLCLAAGGTLTLCSLRLDAIEARRRRRRRRRAMEARQRLAAMPARVAPPRAGHGPVLPVLPSKGARL